MTRSARGASLLLRRGAFCASALSYCVCSRKRGPLSRIEPCMTIEGLDPPQPGSQHSP
jgi:hypothetical protein